MALESTVRPQTLQLPTTAPLIRVTAGMGSVGQKTWNLRRPVTLLGSRRPAHIVLHDPDIREAHCVIVNTGSQLLIKDLHTASGTLRNDTSVDLAALADGDLLQLGETRIQVAIQRPNDPEAADWCVRAEERAFPFDPPCILSLEEIDTVWEIQDPVVLLGSHEKAALRLDHPNVSERHAVLFRFCNAPAIFELGSRYGLFVNDQRCSLTPLHHGDVLRAGPFRLCVGRLPGGGIGHRPGPRPADGPNAESPQSVPASPASPDETVATEALSDDLYASWKSLNAWEADLHRRHPQRDENADSLAAWEVELERKEAALRGKLHDLERYHELVARRELDLNALAQRNKEEAQRLIDAQNELAERYATLEKKEAEMHRRETAVTQRWSRMKRMTCPRCKSPVEPNPPDTSSTWMNSRNISGGPLP